MNFVSGYTVQRALNGLSLEQQLIKRHPGEVLELNLSEVKCYSPKIKYLKNLLLVKNLGFTYHEVHNTKGERQHLLLKLSRDSTINLKNL